MRAEEVRQLTDSELKARELYLREEIRKAKFRKYSGELTDVTTIKKLRRDLARVLTELRRRELEKEKK